MVKSIYSKHAICLIAIFTVGNAMLYFPRHEDALQGLFGLMIAFAFAAIYYIFAGIILQNFDLTNCGKIKKIVLVILGTALSVISAAAALKDYTDYVADYRLKSTSKTIIIILAAIAVYFIATAKKEAIFKLAIVSAVYSAITTVTFFVISIPQFSFDNMLPLELNLNVTLKSALILFARCFGEIITLIFLFRQVPKKQGIKAFLLGLLFAVLLLSVCILNIIFVFGRGVSAKLDLPYVEAMSIISLGDTFTRFEGFEFLTYFLFSIIKSAAAVFCVTNIFEQAANVNKKLSAAISCFIIFVMCLLMQQQLFYSNIFIVGLVVIEIVLLLFSINIRKIGIQKRC